jgi:hypothetical protein
VARVLVDLDIIKAILLELEIDWKHGTFIQVLYYWNMSFHFKKCWKVDHLWHDYVDPKCSYGVQKD